MKEVINYDSEACGFAQSKFSMRSRSIHFGPGIHPDSSSYQIYPKGDAFSASVAIGNCCRDARSYCTCSGCLVQIVQYFLRRFRDDLFFLFF